MWTVAPRPVGGSAVRQLWTRRRVPSVACWPMNDADDDRDPAASTQMFQAFVDRHRGEPEQSGSPWPVVAAGVVVLVIVVVVAWFIIG